MQGDGTAIRYRVAVGRAGKQWFGRARRRSKHVRPAWSPPEEVRRDKPSLPDVIPPSGAPNNPMGARALTLNRGEYAIHGTNNPKSIGTFASYGCIRMLNADIIDLFDRVAVGTECRDALIPGWEASGPQSAESTFGIHPMLFLEERASFGAETGSLFRTMR